MENFYIYNKETQKIELDFEKSSYSALTEEQKSNIKRAFLWSRRAGRWVSRAKYPHLRRPKRVAQDLGLQDGGEEGEAMSFEEQQQQKEERAAVKAERFEKYAENAKKRAADLRKPLEQFSGDIAFFTQPNVNTSAGRAFTNYRNSLFSKQEKSWEEDKKSQYWQYRAETARATAENASLKDVGFLERRLGECKKRLCDAEKLVEKRQDFVDRIKRGEILRNWRDEEISLEMASTWLAQSQEDVTRELDKISYYEKKKKEAEAL